MGVPEGDDEALVRDIARGSESALGDLYDRYHRRCFAVALRMLRDTGDADEAVQETFIRVWRGARSFDPSRASVATWLFTIQRNVCTDDLRRRGRQVVQDSVELTHLVLADEDRTDALAERSILAGHVREALAGLPDEQRSAIELVYFGRLTSDEVGRLLDVPAATIRSRLRLGISRLRASLQLLGVTEA